MTKDWDAVQEEIKHLSWVQKKRLDEVRRIMESKHGFKASTRAYRMKLSEWGYVSRKSASKAGKDPQVKKRKRQRQRGDDGGEGSESEGTVGGPSRDQDNPNSHTDTPRGSTNLEAVLLGRATIRAASVDADGDVHTGAATLQGSEDLLPHVASGESTEAASGLGVSDVVMEMLALLLEGDCQRLESFIMQHPEHINSPVGEPFDIPGGRFFNHPVMQSCVLLQHPGQTLMDIACALPTGPIIWVLLAHGAKGTKHPLGTDHALHNAIKNGRLYTVQALLMPGRSNVNGEPGTQWKPILQAVYWNQPAIVRVLIDRGASVNATSPWVDGSLKNALMHCTERRQRDYLNATVKDDCNKILKLLLNAGADIHATPGGEASATVFETFLRPWQDDPHWVSKLTADEMDCLESFIRKGADLKTPFTGFICNAHSYNHFQHQVLWHTTPAVARSLVDHASPSPEGNGNTLLHEIVGSCPGAKRHPSDTLRDIEVLLGRGADPNYLDESMFTPLRRCIEHCPAVDIIPRLRLLLDGGADPELKHSNRLPPYVLAARTFEEPLRSQIMDFLVAKIKGRQPRVVYDNVFTWSAGYFPIPDEPTWEHVQLYNGQNGDFIDNLDRMVPEDVRPVFQRACFSVASTNFLNAATLRAKMSHPLAPTVLQKDEIYQAVAQRQAIGLPAYSFDQAFVMLLLKPHMTPLLPAMPTSASRASPPAETCLLPHQTPIASTAQDEPSVVASSSAFQFNASGSTSNDSHRSRSDSSDIDLCIPEATLLRWPHPGERTTPGDVRCAKEYVLSYRCEDCASGTLLTKAELEKHAVEHEHSRWCVEEGCRRRFCGQRA